MGAFAFHDAYLKADDFSMDESDSEQANFDIDSDASDADLLELKQELNKLGPEKAQRDLADATVAAQEMTLQRWKRYCEFVRKDHLKLLRSCSIMSFKGYLIWYHKTHPRARRLNTYESVWKTLRQLYYDICHKVVADDVGKEITNYLHGQFSREGLSMDPFSQNVTFSSVDLGLVMKKAKPTMGAVMEAVMNLIFQHPGTLKGPQPVDVYKVSGIEKAFRSMQSGKNIGKIVVEMDEDAMVPVMPSSLPTYSFESNATYVIAGGLGGLGRSITRWMVNRNARNFLLLSRSGAKSKEALELVEEMSARGIKISAPPCDVSCEAALSATIESIAENFWTDDT